MLGDGSEVLSYMIEAYDLATPVFRAVRDEVAATTRAVQASLVEMQRSMETAAGATGKYGDSVKDLGTVQSKTAATTVKATTATRDLATETAKLTDLTAKQAGASKSAAAEAAALSSAHTRVSGASRQATASHSSQSGALEVLGTKMTGAGNKTRQLGTTLSSLTIPIVGLTAVSVDFGLKFGAAMERLHTQAGYTQSQVNLLSKAVLAVSPQAAQTPQAIADGLYHIASVGIPAAHAMDLVKEAAIGANIGNAKFADVANLLATTLKNFPQIAGGAAGAMGQINQIVGAGNIHMEDLATALGQVIPTAKSVGLNLRDVGAAIDVMTSHGVPLEMAVTRLRMGLSLMEAPTAKATTELGRIGISQGQLASDMRKPDGLIVALDDLKKHLDDAYPPGRALSIQQEQQDLDSYADSLKKAGVSGSTLTKEVTAYYQALKQGGSAAVAQTQLVSGAFGGARSGAGILQLLQNTPDLKQVQARIQPGVQAILDLTKAQEGWEKTPQASFDKLKAGLAATATEVGDSIEPEVLPALREIATEVEHIAKAFQDLPGPVKTGIIALLGIGAVAGPLLKIGGNLMRLTGGVTTLFGKLTGGGKDTVGGAASELGGGGLVGARGSAVLAGSMANPIAVMMVGGGVGPAGIGADAAEAEEGETMSSGGVILPRGVSVGEAAVADAPTLEKAGASIGGSLLSTVKGGIGSIFGNAGAAIGVGIGGELIAQIAGAAVGGRTGSTISKTGGDAAIGASLGTLLMPGIGTAVGGGIGGLFGLASSLSSNSMSSGEAQDILKKQLADLQSYAGSVRDIKSATDAMIGSITADVPAGTARINDMLAAFAGAGDTIKKGMDQGEVSIGKGMAGLLSIVSQENAKGVTNFKQSMTQINELLSMPEAQDNLTTAMKAMITTIEQQMSRGQISVQQGVTEINHILSTIKKTININVQVHEQFQSQDTPLGYNQGMEAIATGNPSGVAPGKVPTLTGKSPESQIANFLKSKGLSTNAIAGLLANFNSESGFNPTSQNPGGHQVYGVGAALPTDHAYGLAQWLGGRATDLANFARAEHQSPSSLAVQLQFLWNELQGNYASQLKELQGASSPSEAAADDYFDYEGGNTRKLYSEGIGDQTLGGRESYATSIASQLNGGKLVSNATGSGGSLTNPDPAQGKTPPATGYHYDWRTETYHLFTAAQFKAMQKAWYSNPANKGKAMPTSKPKNPLPGAVSNLDRVLGTSGQHDLSLGSALTSEGQSVESTLTTSLAASGTAAVQAASTAPGSMANKIDRSSISQLQALVQEARKSGNQKLVTGFLKDMESVTTSWGQAVDSQFNQKLTGSSNAEQLKIAKQQLGVTGVTVKNGKVVFTGTQAANPAATSATDPAYLAAQMSDYGSYITNLQGERAQLQTQAATAKKNHNKKLVASLNGDIASVDEAIQGAKIDAAGIAEAYQQAVYQAMLTSFQNAAAAFDSVAGNAGTLAGAGQAYGDVAGTSFNALSALSSSQGGLTVAQKAQANQDLAQYQQGVYGQEAPISGLTGGSGLNNVLGGLIATITPGASAVNSSDYAGWSQLFGGAGGSELGSDFSALASGQLNPTDQQAMLTAVIGLIGQLASLESGVAQQTTATNGLTSATVQMGAQMSTFGGQVTFTIDGDQSGQSYIAGGTQSSVMTSRIGVGM